MVTGVGITTDFLQLLQQDTTKATTTAAQDQVAMTTAVQDQVTMTTAAQDQLTMTTTADQDQDTATSGQPHVETVPHPIASRDDAPLMEKPAASVIGRTISHHVASRRQGGGRIKLNLPETKFKQCMLIIHLTAIAHLTAILKVICFTSKLTQ
uniref:Uncharacterized protein n=1 Tax=Cacopsylla melanoneura TaxID=428564 RepID=A0A8D9FDB1_9HEMI